MDALITHSAALPDRLVLKKAQNLEAVDLSQGLTSRQTCLCCANPLLRHVNLGKLYWRCNHCYQAMPVETAA